VPAARGATPAGTNPQIPGEPGVLQALQVSVHALLQQTPSTQNPLTQSPPQAQAAPLGWLILLVPEHATTGASTDASGFVPGEWPPHPMAPNERARIALARAPRRFGMRQI
jgi:hypothetical protein